MYRFILLAGCVALASCASITRGTNEAFTVNTNPSGAHVTLSTGQVCDATPCVFARIPRKAEFTVTIEKPGYRTTTHAITHHTAGSGAAGMAGNVLVGGIIGGLIDANNGSTQDLVPNPLTLDLEPEAPAVADVAPAPAAAALAGPAAPVVAAH